MNTQWVNSDFSIPQLVTIYSQTFSLVSGWIFCFRLQKVFQQFSLNLNQLQTKLSVLLVLSTFKKS